MPCGSHGLDGTVTYVNRSFSRIYGYEGKRSSGVTPSIIASGRHDHAFFDAIWAAAATGQTWSGPLINRAKDGYLLELEAVISPIRDASDRLVGFMQTDRDVTRERALESEIARRTRERG